MMRTNYVVTGLVVAVVLQAVLVTAGVPDWIPPEMLDMIADDKARCMSEHGTTEAMIAKANDGNLENDRSITCYMYCLLESFSLVDEDGVFDTDMLMGVLPDNLQDRAAGVMDACGHESGSDPCEKVFNTARCVQGKAPELWFVV